MFRIALGILKRNEQELLSCESIPAVYVTLENLPTRMWEADKLLQVGHSLLVPHLIYDTHRALNTIRRRRRNYDLFSYTQTSLRSGTNTLLLSLNSCHNLAAFHFNPMNVPHMNDEPHIINLNLSSCLHPWSFILCIFSFCDGPHLQFLYPGILLYYRQLT